MAIVPLNRAQIDSALSEHPKWQLSESQLCRRLQFANFSEAFGFLTRLALAAESMDHHPEISNCYRDVELRLSTHEAGGISERDFALASAVDALLGER